MSPWLVEENKFYLRRLGKTSEELGELQAVIGRCIIQGIEEVDPSSGFLNRRRLEDEVADVLAQLQCLSEAFNLDVESIAVRREQKLFHMQDWEEALIDAGEK